MTFDATTTDLEDFSAPWGKEIKLQNMDFKEGMNLLRVRIREGKRFTDLDLDPDTAEHLARALLDWAAKQER